MANEQTPVVGEPFKPYVNSQITARQKIYGSGFSSARSPQEMKYLNSNTSWVKLASSVFVTGLFNDSDGSRRLKKMGLKPDSNGGKSLAESAVLFNGLTPLNGNMRSGVATSNSLINNSAYGFGGTEFGLQPLPGITNIEVTPINKGSLKEATVSIKAYNKFQFELIETLYLRLGYTMMLEWGNSIYVTKEGKVVNSGSTLIDNFFFKQDGSTHLDVLNIIEQEREKKQGNYDAIFARVVNFDWTYQPDGSYDISVKLTSLGDVVESFKTNVLTPSTQIDESSLPEESEENEVSDDKVNKNTISNFLYLIRSKYTEVEFKDPKSGVIHVNEIESPPGAIASLFSSSTPIESKFYIRLGTLLEYIEREVLIHISNGGGGSCFPLFYINTSTDCVMRSKPKLISVEPQTCIIRPDFPLMGITQPEWAESMKGFDTGNYLGNTGFIHNIYLNFNFVEKTIESNLDKEGNITFYTFLTSILGGINRSLSNICDLEATVNEEKNEVIIRDQKLPVRQTKNGPLPENQKSNIIEVTGFKNGESNFVKGFSFKTQITSKLATMLSIGATANNNSVNEDATAFSKWNSGLRDRFNRTATDGTPDRCIVKIPGETPKDKPKEKPTSWEIFWDNTIGGVIEYISEGFSSWVESMDERRSKYEKLRDEWNNSLDTYLQASFSKNFTIIKGGTGQGGKAKKTTYLGKKYFQNDPDFITKGKNIMKNYITVEDVTKYTKDNTPSSNIGFIPIELSLDIEGMSGIKVYNQLRLNTDFLPYNYPKTMEFVVMGVGHKIDGSGWTTSINAIGKPQDDGKSLPPKASTQGPLQEPNSTAGFSTFGLIDNNN